MYGPEDFERPRLPTKHRARVELKTQTRAGIVVLFLLLVPIAPSLRPPAEAEPPAKTGDTVILLVVPGGVWFFGATIVWSRLRIATATLAISDEGLEMTALRGGRKIAWSEVGKLKFASAAGPVQAAAQSTFGAFGAAGGVAYALLQGGHPLNPFAFQGPPRGGRVPFGAVYDKSGRRVMSFSEAFDWPLYDDLGPEAHARGIPIEADRVLVEPTQ